MCNQLCWVILKVDMEERFCQKVKQLGCTCVTISHRPALMAFHDIVLALDGEGGWSLHRGARGLSSEEGHGDQSAGDLLSSTTFLSMLALMAHGSDAQGRLVKIGCG